MTFGCQTTEFAGHCLGISRTNAVLATLLFAAAAIGFHHWWLEVRADG